MSFRCRSRQHAAHVHSERCTPLSISRLDGLFPSVGVQSLQAHSCNSGILSDFADDRRSWANDGSDRLSSGQGAEPIKLGPQRAIVKVAANIREALQSLQVRNDALVVGMGTRAGKIASVVQQLPS